MKNTFSKRIVSALLTIATLLTLLTGTSALRAAASYAGGFPLEYSGKSYGVSVLGQYSNGARHNSYIEDYILHRSYSYSNSVMDIMAPQNTKVYAVEAGTVYQNYYTSGGGWIIVLRHNDGNYSYYGHLNGQAVIPKGCSVAAGTLLGYVGMTGTATGYHLHFEWSGHDPYCTYKSRGLCYIANNSGASRYPHTHSGSGSTGTGNSVQVIRWDKITVTNVTTNSAYVRADVTSNVSQIRQIGLMWGTTNALNNTPVSWSTVGFSKLTYCSVQFGTEAPSLSPNTKYYFRFFVTTVNGTKIYSGMYAFLTQPAACSHTFDAGRITKRPTCTASGTKICTCTKCGYSKNVAVGAYGHAYRNGVCTRCGARKPSPITWNQIYASNITRNRAYVRCNVTADVKQIREIGLCWGTTKSLTSRPVSWSTVGNSKLTYCSVQFGTEAPLLQPNTTYYYRFFVTTVNGEKIYSNLYWFRTAA